MKALTATSLAAAVALVSALIAQGRPAAPRMLIVAIDPGHGGEDTGVVGAGGIEEKQLTLDVALQLRAHLDMQPEMRAVLTREDDRALSPDERAASANTSRADLFLSLHANASPSPTLAGAEVYYRQAPVAPSPSLVPEPAALLLMPWNLAYVRHADESARLGAIVHEALQAHVQMSPRAAQPAPLRAVSGVDMPAVLVELLFLTNPEQEDAAASLEFRERLVLGLAEALVRMRGLDGTGGVP